jgi:LmbE family N-acetylglucosaminyl deacetylase
MPIDTYTPRRALVVSAHPDDIEFTVAGTVARWVRAGAEVGYVVCTSGEAGFDDVILTTEQAWRIREAEQVAAAKLVGVDHVTFLREPDGWLDDTIALRQRLVREIRRFRPDTLVTGDPTLWWADPTYLNHPDHRAASAAALTAAAPASSRPRLLPEAGPPAHRVERLYVWCWDPAQADHFVDITDTLDLKIAALRQHPSQIPDDPSPLLRTWAAAHGAAAGVPHAEGFRLTVSGESLAGM